MLRQSAPRKKIRVTSEGRALARPNRISSKSALAAEAVFSCGQQHLAATASFVMRGNGLVQHVHRNPYHRGHKAHREEESNHARASNVFSVYSVPSVLKAFGLNIAA